MYETLRPNSLEDILESIIRDFSSFHQDNIIAVIPYGSFLYQDLESHVQEIEVAEFRDKLPDMIVVYRDKKTFFLSLWEQFGWDGEDFFENFKLSHRWVTRKKSSGEQMLYYRPDTSVRFTMGFQNGGFSGVRLPYKFGAISLDEYKKATHLDHDLSGLPFSKSLYLPARLRGKIRPYFVMEDGEHILSSDVPGEDYTPEQADIMKGILDSRRLFIDMAFRMVSGKVTGKKLLEKYIASSYKAEGYRLETYKARQLMRKPHVRDMIIEGMLPELKTYVQENHIPVTYSGTELTQNNFMRAEFDSGRSRFRTTKPFFFWMSIDSLVRSLRVNKASDRFSPGEKSQKSYVLRKIKKILAYEILHLDTVNYSLREAFQAV